jgi:hypothetical protein
MLPNEFYSVVEDTAGRVHGQLHRLRADGNWTPPLPEGVEPPAELTMLSRLIAGENSRSITRSSSSEPRRPSWMLREPEPWRLR